MDIISRSDLKRLIDEKADFLLIDVREEDELIHGKIPTSHNLPMSEIEAAFDMSPQYFEKRYGFTLDKSKPIVFYCRSGGRSTFAARLAKLRGFNAVSYKGSILEWAEIDPNVEKY